ncbi:hypothetical protein E1B28_010047 [Marasmius oreades]|uniref:Uncharacterized protein n=1 Tax=Marasmius oreades TaxID=181124 RepID=A0A9P7URD6_9AGAR|nr:uncharacterized protein E1B28_010047 [Marasmius oreades]KAG7090980.1 hypothetical protein E1B28_010047 [Marasmius oreades]
MPTFSFRLFRRLIAGLFALAHLTSGTLELSLHATFAQPVIAWILSGFEMILIGWFITAAIVKPILKKPHTVAQELFSSFAMFILSIVLSLVALTVSLKSEGMKEPHIMVISGIWLRVLVFASFSQVAYTFSFFILVGMTAATYDRSIWLRNMDGSPSPFSMTILLSFMLPCIFKPCNTVYMASLTAQDDNISPSRPHCYDRVTCNCPAKEGPVSDLPVTTTTHTNSLDETAVSQLATPLKSRSQVLSNLVPWRNSGTTMSLSKSLIEIPDAAQRRMSYPVALNRGQDDILVGM